MNVPFRLYGNTIVFHPDDPRERYQMPYPHSEELDESLRRFGYNLSTVTQADAYRVLAAAEAYIHFAGHPAPTNRIVHKLRELRRAVKAIDADRERGGE